MLHTQPFSKFDKVSQLVIVVNPNLTTIETLIIFVLFHIVLSVFQIAVMWGIIYKSNKKKNGQCIIKFVNWWYMCILNYPSTG